METNKINVIIVDDSDFTRATINQMLEGQTHLNIIGEASGAKEVYRVIKDRKPDLAIIDVVMPETSGIELAQKLKEGLRDIQIIMMSSLAQENIIIDSISAGATDFLQKPFTKEHLLAAIDKAIEKIGD